ncbi:hypothetical protein ACLB2K_069234 [Fragaria x ananassa]
MEVLTSILHKVTGSQSPIRWDEHNLTLIGSGSSGPVYLAKDQSGFPIAVKKAHIRELDEVKLLSKLSHKNIVTKEETSYILLEYVHGESISSQLMKRPFSENKIRTYTQQLLSGLQYLHQKEIKHGDIKGANILIDADGCIKLADFGLSKQGAQLWMAPEVLDKDLHNSRT